MENDKTISKPKPKPEKDFSIASMLKDLRNEKTNMVQNSKVEVERFKKIKVDKETIKSINLITEIISQTKNYDEFNFLIKKHEQIISNLIKKTCVKNLKFKDFKGEIKSLGAWGGDFILASGINSPSYFESKGYKTIFKFDDMIYRKEY